jgi:hypothetical protein
MWEGWLNTTLEELFAIDFAGENAWKLGGKLGAWV